MERLLAPAEVARLLGVSSQTVRVLADRGALRIAAKTSRGIRLFKSDDVERLRVARDRAATMPRAPVRGNKS